MGRSAARLADATPAQLARHAHITQKFTICGFVAGARRSRGHAIHPGADATLPELGYSHTGRPHRAGVCTTTEV